MSADAKKIKVLIVDDSALVRRALTEQLAKEPDLEVVGTALDPFVARDRILQLKPDVLTLDLEMPRMDGLEFLQRLMVHHPMPVVVVSSLTRHGSQAALSALAFGAIDVVPKGGNQFSVPAAGLADAIRGAARAVPKRRHAQVPRTPMLATLRATDKTLVLGASTGGPRAIELVLGELPEDCLGGLVVQHMPEGFTAPFAERLDSVCRCRVREARDGDRIAPGQILIAPAGRHCRIVRSGAQPVVQLFDGPRIHHQRPAVDVMFHSAAQQLGANALGVLLTGLGRDGAAGLRALRAAGAHTIAEAEETCVVYGMPRAAIELDAAAEVLPLDEVAPAILAASQR